MVEVSILIPCIKKSYHLKRLIPKIESQTFKDFEIIIDDTDKPVSVKRNQMIRKAKGEWIILIDDDIKIHKNWLKEFMRYKQKDAIIGGPQSISDFGETFIVPTCNALLHKNVAKRVKFDESFKLAADEDSEWCMRAKNEGIKLIMIPNACVHHILGGGFLHRCKKEFQFGSERCKVENKWNIPYQWKMRLRGQIMSITKSLFHISGIFYGLLKYKVFKR